MSKPDKSSLSYVAKYRRQLIIYFLPSLIKVTMIETKVLLTEKKMEPIPGSQWFRI